MVSDDKKFYEWIIAHSSDDTSRLRFKYAGKSDGMDYADAILQIDCRRKYAKKLPDTLSKTSEFYFPSALAGEQSTSDALAAYHASLVSDATVIADLTSGLGIDCIHMAPKAVEVIAVEQQPALAETLRHNASVLGISNIRVICDDCRDYIKTVTANSFSHIFIDPARRDALGRRVYALAQCTPDVAAMLPVLKRAATTVIVKMSPMLDISAVLSELPGTTRMISLGTQTECKELVAIVSSDESASTLIDAVTIKPDGSESHFEFTQNEEASAPIPDYAVPDAGNFIFDPYPSIMKAGAPKLICDRYGLKKPAPNTMVFFSDKLHTDFPGIIYEVCEVITYESKHIKRLKKKYPLISVATRNFDISADALRAKLGVKDGGNLRLLAFNDAHQAKFMLIMKRVDKA